MAEVNLKEQIDLLVRLQNIDTQIYQLRKEQENIPIKQKESDESFANKKENLKLLENKGLDLQKQRKAQELELASKEEEARKMQTQLFQIKTNKEYAAKLKEIETVKADASVFEDKILELFEEADKLKSQINQEKQLLVEEEKKNNQEKEKLNLRSKEIEHNLHQLQAQREQLSKEIAPEILAKYERIISNRESLAIVKVGDDSACQGCFMKVSPQVINLI